MSESTIDSREIVLPEIGTVITSKTPGKIFSDKKANSSPTYFVTGIFNIDQQEWFFTDGIKGLKFVFGREFHDRIKHKTILTSLRIVKKSKKCVICEPIEYE